MILQSLPPRRRRQRQFRARGERTRRRRKTRRKHQGRRGRSIRKDARVVVRVGWWAREIEMPRGRGGFNLKKAEEDRCTWGSC